MLITRLEMKEQQTDTRDAVPAVDPLFVLLSTCVMMTGVCDRKEREVPD